MRKFIAIAAAVLLGTFLMIHFNKSDKMANPAPAPMTSPGPSSQFQTSSTATGPNFLGDGNPFVPGAPAEFPGWFAGMPAPPSQPGNGMPNQPPAGQPVQQPPVQQPAMPSAPDTPSAPATNEGTSAAYAQQVLQLVNQQRASAGLGALTMDESLSHVAMVKAQDMFHNNYFDHNSPTYGSPFDMMKSFGISFKAAGENIAKGQTSPQQVMNDWMNSPGHRANILNGNFSRIGIAEYNGEWVQEFVG